MSSCDLLQACDKSFVGFFGVVACVDSLLPRIMCMSGGVVLAMRAVVASRKLKIEIHISFGQELKAFYFILFFHATTYISIFADREVAITSVVGTIRQTCYITF